MIFLLLVLDKTVDIITILVVVHVVLSFFRPDRNNIFVKTVNKIVEPMLTLIREKLPRTGMIDFSPMVLILGLEIIRAIIFSLVNSFING